MAKRYKVLSKTCPDKECKGNGFSYCGTEYKRTKCEYCGGKLVDFNCCSESIDGGEAVLPMEFALANTVRVKVLRPTE